MTWQLHSGSGAPGSMAGQTNGDNYIDIDTKDLYQLNAGTWSKICTLSHKTIDTEVSFSDNTTGDVSSSQHGFAPKKWMTAYESFTPSWNNVTVGSGTNEGYYKQKGKEFKAHGRLILAADSAISGSVSITLPVTIRDYGSITPIGSVSLIVAGSGTAYIGDIRSNGVIYAHTVSGSYVRASLLSATIPATWTTGDSIRWELKYEAA